MDSLSIHYPFDFDLNSAEALVEMECTGQQSYEMTMAMWKEPQQLQWSMKTEEVVVNE